VAQKSDIEWTDVAGRKLDGREWNEFPRIGA
jgi:hypothetical protein